MKTEYFLSLVLMLCISLLFSCTNVERDNSYDEKSINYVGDNIQIGEQVWMARNLNVNVSGSKCYDNEKANCDKYGRLYTWATAMNLPSECNYASASTGPITSSIPQSCRMSEKHRGICPKGWHIPSSTEWGTLVDYFGGSKTAGKYLKSSDWGGDDRYGFLALPGGYGSGDNSFYDVGDAGSWWNASQHEVCTNYGTYRSCRHYVGCNGMSRTSVSVEDCSGGLRSVRCVKD